MAFYTSVKRWSVLVFRACHLVTSTHQWHYSLARVIQLGAVFIATEIASTAVSFFLYLGEVLLCHIISIVIALSMTALQCYMHEGRQQYRRET